MVEDGDVYVATATSYAFAMTVPGGARVPAAGVAQVGVLPTHRRQGLLRDVLGALLEQAAGLGDHYAILNASDTGIYGRFGFGQADRVLRIELDTDHVELVVAPAEGRVRLVDAHDAHDLVAGLYERFGRERPGAVGRSAAWWALGPARRGLVAGDREPVRRRARGRRGRSRRLRHLPLPRALGPGPRKRHHRGP